MISVQPQIKLTSNTHMELVYEIAWMMSIYHMVIFKNKTCQIAYLV